MWKAREYLIWAEVLLFDDLDRTLELLLRHELPASLLDHVSISFIAPDNQFPPSGVTLPAIDLFLYDVRENRDLRSTEIYMERQSDGSMVRKRPPVRVDCSYLITVWPSDASPNRAADEHMLLGEILKVLVRHPILPNVLLQGSLAGNGPSIGTLSIQQGNLQSWGDFWSAIGSKPKAVLNFTVTIAVPVEVPLETESLVTDKTLHFHPSSVLQPPVPPAPTPADPSKPAQDPSKLTPPPANPASGARP